MEEAQNHDDFKNKGRKTKGTGEPKLPGHCFSITGRSKVSIEGLRRPYRATISAHEGYDGRPRTNTSARNTDSLENHRGVPRCVKGFLEP